MASADFTGNDAGSPQTSHNTENMTRNSIIQDQTIVSLQAKSTIIHHNDTNSIELVASKPQPSEQMERRLTHL